MFSLLGRVWRRTRRRVLKAKVRVLSRRPFHGPALLSRLLKWFETFRIFDREVGPTECGRVLSIAGERGGSSGLAGMDLRRNRLCHPVYFGL